MGFGVTSNGLYIKGLAVFSNGFLIRRSQVRVLPGVLTKSSQAVDDSSGHKTPKSEKNKKVTASNVDDAKYFQQKR